MRPRGNEIGIFVVKRAVVIPGIMTIGYIITLKLSIKYFHTFKMKKAPIEHKYPGIKDEAFVKRA